MNTRIRRLALILALAGAALAGAGAAGAGSLVGSEAAHRIGLTNCVLVAEARTLGLDPAIVIPDTARACTTYTARLRYIR